ncbi:MAG: hypothetical protein LBS17_06080 [Actinomycetes bacterium]|jgi:hypothetical protein|nr:hypothetical protein [Actinomycetes bacterium]
MMLDSNTIPPISNMASNDDTHTSLPVGCYSTIVTEHAGFSGEWDVVTRLVRIDPKKAVKLFIRSIHPERAQGVEEDWIQKKLQSFLLGQSVLFGIEVRIDPKKAAKLFIGPILPVQDTQKENGRL